jgi:hypothetical protein
MATNPFDQGARYLFKRDPPGCFHWLTPGLEGLLAFRDWLDTRTVPFPGEPDRICDTAGVFDPVGGEGPSWAIVVEFQARSEAQMLDRVLEYLVRLWRQPHPSGSEQGRRQVAAAVVNLTGPAQPDKLDMPLPGGTSGRLHFGMVQRNLRDEEAASTLQGIATGTLTHWLLPWIPLMRGGAEPAIIDRWKQLASAVPDSQARADYGGLALVFAELAGCWEVWKKALEGWNVLVSKQVLEWQAQARAEAQAETKRDDLIRALQVRFQSPLPADLTATLSEEKDLETLSRWFDLALTAASLEAFQAAVSPNGVADIGRG